MQTLNDGTYRAIADLMHSAVGLSFADSKKALIASRLATRIQRLGLDGFEDYLALIERPDDGGEFQVAVDLLTTNETYFFREPAHFELLARELPQPAKQPLGAVERGFVLWRRGLHAGHAAHRVAGPGPHRPRVAHPGYRHQRPCAAQRHRSRLPRPSACATSIPSACAGIACAARARPRAWCRSARRCANGCASASST